MRALFIGPGKNVMQKDIDRVPVRYFMAVMKDISIGFLRAEYRLVRQFGSVAVFKFHEMRTEWKS